MVIPASIYVQKLSLTAFTTNTANTLVWVIISFLQGTYNAYTGPLYDYFAPILLLSTKLPLQVLQLNGALPSFRAFVFALLSVHIPSYKVGNFLSSFKPCFSRNVSKTPTCSYKRSFPSYSTFSFIHCICYLLS